MYGVNIILGIIDRLSGDVCSSFSSLDIVPGMNGQLYYT